jgi:flagellar biosynthesis/type III secretory pathway ATPase
MTYEVKDGNTGHIFSERNLSAAKHYAQVKGLKVIERKTGKIIYPEQEKDNDKLHTTNNNK